MQQIGTPLRNGSFTRRFDGASTTDTWPRFHMAEVEDPLASQGAGRPIFREEERVELNFPGNPFSKPVQRVNDEHRQRWPDEYAAFKKGQEVAISGTPIDVLPFLKPAQVRELKALDIMTAEQLANLNDHGIQRIAMGGRRLKDLAAAYLDDAQAMAMMTQRDGQIDRLSAENAALKLQVETMQAQMQQIWGQLQDKLNTPNAIMSAIPAMSDPVELAKMGKGPELPARSSLDDLPAVPHRRRGKAAEAPTGI